MRFWLCAGMLGTGLFLACSKDIPLEKHSVLHPNNSLWKEWTIQRQPNGDTLIQGAFKEFYWNGSPSQVTQYQDGIKEGTSQAWYEGGSLKWAKVFSHGKPSGIWRLYSVDGRPRLAIPYAEGKISGTVKIWDRTDTTKVQTAQYSKDQCAGGVCGAIDSVKTASQALPQDPKHPDADGVLSFLE